MSFGEVVVLSLIIAGFTVFGVMLAWVSYDVERGASGRQSHARRKAASPSLDRDYAVYDD
jgi:hypothetical protein